VLSQYQSPTRLNNSPFCYIFSTNKNLLALGFLLVEGAFHRAASHLRSLLRAKNSLFQGKCPPAYGRLLPSLCVEWSAMAHSLAGLQGVSGAISNSV